MAIDDIVFSDGEIVNFVLEMGSGTSNIPVDILADPGNEGGKICLETPVRTENVVANTPEVILLSDGRLAKKVSDSFYLKL